MVTSSTGPDSTSLEYAIEPPLRATTPLRVSLVVVGIGIQWAGQTTLAAKRAIECADHVLFAVSNPRAAQWIRYLKPAAESLAYPRDGRPRREIYRAMVERILQELRTGKSVCAVFYGSPTVLTSPAHEIMRQAHAEGFRTRMLPGVSSLDCLFADLGIDPGEVGCQIYEASDFLSMRRVIDPRSHLVLCQPALIGHHGTFDGTHSQRIRHGLELLGKRLRSLYSDRHAAVIYEAAEDPLHRHRADRLPLDKLGDATLSEISTMYVPPLVCAAADGRPTS